MVKSELIYRIAEKQENLTLEDIEISINTTLDCLCDALGQGKRIEIRGFGSFSLRHRRARTARNPKTGNPVKTEDKFSIRFKPGLELRDKVNET
ncbi:MAG: HU family DNA-binding protein [Gammaproteobacteria bacterium]